MRDNETEMYEIEQEEIKDFEFLKRGLLLGKGFQLYLVVANTIDEQKKIIDKLSEIAELSVEVIPSSRIDAMRFVQAIHESFNKLNHLKGLPVVVLHEIDELVFDEPRLLRRLNELRNEIISRVSGAILILAGGDTIQRLRREAPDIWSIRDADLDVAEKSMPNSEVHIDHPPPETIKPPVEEGERIKLEERIRGLPYGEERGRLLLRLADVCKFEGLSGKIAADYYESYYKQAKCAWDRYLDERNAVDFPTFTSLVYCIDELDKSLQTEAASRAWRILADLAEEKGATSKLAQGVITFLRDNTIRVKSHFENFEVWRERFESHALNEEKDEMHLDINLLSAYESIKNNDINQE